MEAAMVEGTQAHDDEDEELVPGRRAFFGMKFHDEESQLTARRVAIASMVLAGLVLLHLVIHIFKHGKLGRALPHALLGLTLPWIGYRAASLDMSSVWRPRLLWLFHLGNVMFVIAHGVMLIVFALEVAELEAASVQDMCDLHRSNDPMLPHAGLRHGPAAMPTLPPQRESFQKCVHDVDAEKAHAPGLMWFWAFVSLPYWACAAYAAYYSHELYLQLRIGELSFKRGIDAGGNYEDDRGIATVGWREAAVE